MDFGGGDGSKAKAWKDIWGSGQGIGAVTEIASAAAFVEKLKREYDEARRRLAL
jgi:nitronate monooxygenase